MSMTGRPGRYGEDPDAIRPRVRLGLTLGPFTIYGGMGLLMMIMWFVKYKL